MGEVSKRLIVVSNTSPLTNLAAINRFSLLRQLFGQLVISPAVEAELSFGGRLWPGAEHVRRADWIKRQTVIERHLVDALRLDLDAGEAETIALALQIDADLVLLDEQAGRRAAGYLGLNVMGVVGILIRAKQLGLVDETRSSLIALRMDAGFYLSKDVIEHALTLADE